LQQHIENICQQHEEALLRAENDKQQALLLGKQAEMIVSIFMETVFVLLHKAKAVPLHAVKALGGRGGIAPTHS
jgi:rootletin